MTKPSSHDELDPHFRANGTEHLQSMRDFYLNDHVHIKLPVGFHSAGTQFDRHKGKDFTEEPISSSIARQVEVDCDFISLS